MIESGGSVNQAQITNKIPLHISIERGHLEITKILIINKSNFYHKNNDGKIPLDLATSDESKQFILKEFRWYSRRSLILTRPHSDHEINRDHKLKALDHIVTAVSGRESGSHDALLYQLKHKIAKYL